MEVTLTAELETLARQKVRSGRYADESDVMRDASLRALELRDEYESPALEAALLAGVRSPHRPTAKPPSIEFARQPVRANEPARQHFPPRRGQSHPAISMVS
jgi:putative addiction module CopG family antidote